MLQLFDALLQFSSGFGRIGEVQVCIVDLAPEVLVFLSQAGLDTLAVNQEVLETRPQRLASDQGGDGRQQGWQEEGRR